MTEIFVDADACPVKDEVMRVAVRHSYKVWFVSNAWMRLDEGPLVERVIVPEGPDVADDWIAERAGPGDIVITADIPLADRCLKNGAAPVEPTGKRFTADTIGMAMAMRELNAHLRETGDIGGGNRSFEKRDRSQFLQTLEQVVQELKRSAHR